MNNNLFQERINEAISKSGMRQKDLSKASGVTESAISRYLSGEILPRYKQAEKLAKALDVSVGWLFGTEDTYILNEEDMKMRCPFRKTVMTNILSKTLTKTEESFAYCHGEECPYFIPKDTIGPRSYCKKIDKEETNGGNGNRYF